MELFKLTKEDEGKEFWILPTQNNVRRGSSYLEQAKLVVISDIKRVYTTINGSKYKLAHYDNSETFALYNSQHNAGWIVFKTEQDLLDFKTRDENTKIVNNLISFDQIYKLSNDQLQRIVDILLEGSENDII